MGILIAIIIVTLVIAAVGGGVYVLIFRAKHKKEVLANSQMSGNLPTFGVEPAQQSQPQGGTPMPDLSGIPNQNQSGPMDSPVMNDITSGGVQNDLASGMPQSPQAPVSPVQEEPSFVASQEQPTVNRNFPDTLHEPEAPAADISGTTPETSVASTNTFDIGQMDQSTVGTGNILDDTETVGSVTEMAEDSLNTAADVDISDSMVPVTRENESLEEVESGLDEAAVSAQTEKREEQNEIPATSIFTEMPQPEQVNVQETPIAPELVAQPESVNIPEAPAAPETSASMPMQDFPNIGQSSETQPAPSMPTPEPSFAPESVAPASESSVVADFPQTPATDSIPQVPTPESNSQDTSAQEMHI